MSFSNRLAWLAVAGVWALAGCASGTYKLRQEQREKLSASSGLYCEFVNGEQHPDIDVELNMQMAKRCDGTKPFSISNYKTSSEMNGIMYCCQNAAHKASEASARSRSNRMPASMRAPTPAPAVIKPAPVEVEGGPVEDDSAE